MKKVLVATLLCAMSTFAAWDKFPVIEDGKGEFKISFSQFRQGDDFEPFSFDGFKVRYSPLAGLELTSQNAADAVGNYVLGVRYQVLPAMLSAGVDFGFPLGYDAIWSFKPNIQFSMPLGAITLGTNFDLAIYTTSADEKYARGLDFTGGVEVDVALSEKSTVWVSFDAETGVSRSKIDKEPKDGIPLKYEGRTLKLIPAVGYIASLGNLDLGTYVSLTFGDKEDRGDFDDKNFKTSVGVEGSVKF